MTPGERIALILAQQGYHLRDDDTSVAPVDFVRLRYGKGHWTSPHEDGLPTTWVPQTGSNDNTPITLELPEAFFTPGYPEADQ